MHNLDTATAVSLNIYVHNIGPTELKVGFHYPSSRAVNSARELGPWTRVVETDLKKAITVIEKTNNGGR